jgi:predicted aspartyl protease
MFNDTILLGMSALKRVDFSQIGSKLTLRQLPN